MAAGNGQAAHAVSQAVAGIASGALSSILVAPLNIIQGRVHVGEETVRSPLDFLRKTALIVQNEGFIKLYEGCGPQVVGSALAWGLFHPIKNYSRAAVLRLERTAYNDPSRHLSGFGRFMATMLASGVTNTIMNPVFLIKTRLNIQRREEEGAYAGPVDCFRRIVREEGPLALFNGLGMFQLGSVGPALRFTLYDGMIERMAREQGGVSSSQRLALNTGTKLATMGAFYPALMLRTRMRHDKAGRSAGQHVMQVWQEFGAAGFYRGFGIHFSRAFPTGIVNLHLYGRLEAMLRRGMGR
ncbi:Mitochondrial carrier protein [Carpediemonas membranifera]|uniref:Mitochondrial carrier protein n=1 Tax=Carpediemonas membranifera TaxID=201153 RepID=A0A8J6B0P1_9EUKA|nr:Mitochondrial carrier protein [Carpediemonas membranifera]|eukprot:KAG9391759.1 Mitochondrial carrier protein [Carpediemonas membranifera]